MPNLTFNFRDIYGAFGLNTMSRLVFAFLSTSIHFMLFHTFMNLPGQIGYNCYNNLNSKGCQENVLNIISLSFLVKGCIFLPI